MAELQEQIFKAMADTSRRRILAALCEESREAGELARLVGLAPNAVSFHLRALKSADLVNVKRDGRFLRYSVEPRNLRSWVEHVGQMFQPEWFDRQPAAAPRRPTSASKQPTFTPKRPATGPKRTEAPAPAEAIIESIGNNDQLPTELL
jgi:DNA-binding transcriptional ArsR family regulator